MCPIIGSKIPRSPRSMAPPPKTSPAPPPSMTPSEPELAAVPRPPALPAIPRTAPLPSPSIPGMAPVGPRVTTRKGAAIQADPPYAPQLPPPPYSPPGVSAQLPPGAPPFPRAPRPAERPTVPRPAVPRPTSATREMNPEAREQHVANSLPSTTPPASGPNIIGAIVGGKYKVSRVLAEGGMGVVYEAVHMDLGRHVALKTLARRLMEDPVAITRFRNEARAAGALGHPNIVEVYDMGTLSDGVPYLVMEKLEGETLGRRIKNERVLPIGDVLDIACDVLSALGIAHANSIVHRDLKPDNVFLSRRLGLKPAIKLLDFGISKPVQLDDEETGNTLTRAGFIMGTPAYMAPEQARGDRNLDGRVDLYAVGVLMYEMLLGRLPYASKHPAALLIELQKTTPPSPRLLRPEIPTWLEEVIAKLMARNRDARYQSAGEALMAINVRRAQEAAGLSASRNLEPSSTPEDTTRTGPPSGMNTAMDADASQKVQIFSWQRKP